MAGSRDDVGGGSRGVVGTDDGGDSVAVRGSRGEACASGVGALAGANGGVAQATAAQRRRTGAAPPLRASSTALEAPAAFSFSPEVCASLLMIRLPSVEDLEFLVAWIRKIHRAEKIDRFL